VQLADATLAHMAGDLPRAYRLIDAVSSVDVHRGEPVRTVLVLTGRSAVLAALDRYDESMAQTVEQLALAQRDRQCVAGRMWEGWHGSQLLQLGQLSDAAAAFEVPPLRSPAPVRQPIRRRPTRLSTATRMGGPRMAIIAARAKRSQRCGIARGPPTHAPARP
jgi:hypothetical protein